MSKNVKLIYSTYDPDSGLSYAVVKSRYGKYMGTARLHLEDIKYESSFAGCKYAELRAMAKVRKAELKELRIKIKTLSDLLFDLEQMKEYNASCFTAKRIRRRLAELKLKEKELKEAINGVENVIAKDNYNRINFIEKRKGQK